MLCDISPIIEEIVYKPSLKKIKYKIKYFIQIFYYLLDFSMHLLTN